MASKEQITERIGFYEEQIIKLSVNQKDYQKLETAKKLLSFWQNQMGVDNKLITK